MQVIAHHRIRPQRDGKHLGQLMQAVFDPLPAVLERLPDVAILTAQEGAAHKAGHAVIGAGRYRRYELVEWVRHGDTRSEERRVGKGCCITSRQWGVLYY